MKTLENPKKPEDFKAMHLIKDSSFLDIIKEDIWEFQSLGEESKE